ncbi:hypothetical protein AMS68_003104 [Peltaster fructicola]|uniref:PIN domain-containing protein n=1 Tax=Peltaster fructicola TaxID=286661 RepID=A0A6H0XS49_9PEZI|nr:hypothetical protein AMS68_003104 [Peltaster fructicola]
MNPPRSTRQQPTSSRLPQSSSKIFNCIADDTALVAGVKRSTRNGLRQWIKNGQIRLFVPLHALEQLNLQKHGSARHAEDVRETLDWLDQATTKFPDAVTLQGGDETFQQWSEVEKFVVPRSMFSENDHDDDVGSSDYKLWNDISGSESPVATTCTTDPSADTKLTGILPSPPTSPSKVIAGSPLQTKIEDGVVPVWLQPLFNYILWRIHQEIDPVAALESFIFLCNDPAKANLAKGFEVRCKRLEQLRDAVAREERDSKNRQQHRSTQSVSSVTDENTLPRSPPTAPAAMLKPQSNVIDPDAFERSTKAPVANVHAARSNGHAQRGRGSMRGRGRGMNSPVRSHASIYTGNGRGRDDVLTDTGPPIDPNSFERPRGGHGGRGGRSLWTPG